MHTYATIRHDDVLVACTYPRVLINCINNGSYVGNEYEKKRTTTATKWYRVCAQSYSRYVHISLISQRSIRCVAFFRRKWRRNFTVEKLAILTYIYIYKYKIAGCFKLPVRRRGELIEKQQGHDLSETSPRWSIRSIRFVEKNRFLRKAYMAGKAKAWKGV